MSGSLSGVEGLTALEDQEEVRKVERQLKQRFPIGSQVCYTLFRSFFDYYQNIVILLFIVSCCRFYISNFYQN